MTSEPVELRRAVRPAAIPAGAAGEVAPLPAPWPAALGTLRAYLALTKPGIIWLLLVTTVPAMILAADGWPALDLVALTLLGGVLTAGGANAMNHWFDRDIDRVMVRTRRRPIPAGLVPPGRALPFGMALVGLGGLELGLTVHWLAALLALGAAAFYILGYTVLLKRRTPQNIVIGGAAGAVPPLVGWAAVTGGLDWAPALLFLIVFLWTPPHFWALALRYREDYARANVPMLPVVRGEAATKRQITLYAVVLAAASLPLVAFHGVGWLYFGIALAAGLLFVAQAVRLQRGAIAPMALFFSSIVYLPVMFVAAAADTLIF